jgi:hypothetical protein
VLTVLFESEGRNAGTFGQTNQGPVSFSIDAGEQRAIPIDVLKQTWRVHYPQSSLLVDSEGQFRPTSGVDQPGWLVSLGRIVWPEMRELPRRLVPLSLFFLTLFVLTMMVIRRRWKTLAALVVVGMLLFMLTLSTSFVGRSSLRRISDLSEGYPPPSSAAATSAPDTDDFAQSDAEQMTRGADEMMGSGMGAGMGGGFMLTPPTALGGMPGMPEPAPVQMEQLFGRDLAKSNNRMDLPPAPNQPVINDPFEVPATPAAEPSATKPQAPTDLPADGVAAITGIGGWEDDRVLGSAGAVSKKGSARLSVNVNLDVPQDYQSRDFVSVADSVHQPSVLSLVVQRRGQIAAIRFLAAMVVILLAWRMRKAVTLWKLTVAISVLLIAVALLPLVSNSWQSVLDGMAIGSVISIAMALVCGCCSVCAGPLTWFRRRTASF